MKSYLLMRKTLALCLALCLALSGSYVAFAADGAVQNDGDVIKSIIAEIDEDYGIKLAKDVSFMGTGKLGFRTAGSRGEKEAANYIEKAMKDLGLSNVRQDPVPVHAWDFGNATLEVNPSSGDKKTLTLSSYAGSPGTAASGITAEIVYAGAGTLFDYEDLDVEGKIVLVEFDMDDDYWFGLPAYQAELKGAKAMIVAYNGENYSVTDDAINSFDSQVRVTIPVMNMSRADAKYVKGLLEKGDVDVTLISDAKIDKNGKSANVVGEIPGKMKDQYIIFTGHYDAYFFAYQDDIIGVGTFLTVAKAVLDSGYQPEHTLVFVASCGEEYGITDSHYDWITGSWYQLTHNTPNWAGNSTICLNFDTLRPDKPEVRLASTPEYSQFFKKYALSLDLPAPWVNGVEFRGTNGPWSDDYNYISSGIPGFMAGGGYTDWRANDYHSNRDNYDNRAYTSDMFKTIAELYASMMVSFDRLLMPPVNFDTLMEDSNDTLDSELIAAAGLSDTALIAASDKFAAASQANYPDILKVNALLVQIDNAVNIGAVTNVEMVAAFKDELMKNRKLALDAYNVMEKEFTKLNAWDEVVYGHEVTQTNLAAVMDAKDALDKKDGEAAMEAITTAESGDAIPLFEKIVYEYYGIDAMDPNRKDLYWGEGKVYPVIDLFDVYHAIAAKVDDDDTDFSAEIKILDTKIAEAKNTMSKALADETSQIVKANAITDKYTLKKVIDLGDEILKDAYKNLPEGYIFGDVAASNWAYKTINDMMLAGVIDNGDEFYPSTATTRGEVAEWLTKAFNLPTTAALPAFSDVSTNHEKAVYVAAVCKAGLMQGMGGGQFMPDSSLTRAQMATIARNILEIEDSTAPYSSFSDVSMNSWYGGTVESINEAGIMIGTGNNMFEPNNMLTRAEACTIVERLMYTK